MGCERARDLSKQLLMEEEMGESQKCRENISREMEGADKE